jgi:hypothetical protein
MHMNETQFKILLDLHDFFKEKNHSSLEDSQIAKALNCNVEEARYHLQQLEKLDYIRTVDTSTINRKSLVVMDLTSKGWMTVNGKIEIDMDDQTHSKTSYVGTQLNQTFIAPGGVQQINLGNINGDLNNTINQLNELGNPETEVLAELLVKIQELLESETSLKPDDKAEALEQVKILAEAGKNPTEGKMQKAAKTAVRILKGIISELSTATKLVEGLNNLLPEISKLFRF